jgi:hypothetical protein
MTRRVSKAIFLYQNGRIIGISLKLKPIDPFYSKDYRLDLFIIMLAKEEFSKEK